ncbi:NPC intracellular cholesterol transporter 2 homolog a-like [Wyeomyia smithii]|uniref:NPC intracellular cholesterol transporter 2 homolog a-like n=1 Tax=Wyeomyia smithii TaxID=174621 RepID=UPI002467C67F|nr:NPC intracellular cholesterol transporter 2 homolog a-like [Wyeomyia smithii]
MYKVLLIAALVPALVLAQTPVRQCPNGAGLPATVDINGCTGSPCPIQNNAPIVAHGWDIVSPVDTATLTAYISVRLLGLEVPFPIPEELVDACEAGTPPGTCPVSAGDVFDYTLDHPGMELPVAGVTVQVEVGLTAADGSAVTCVAFDAQILA